MHKTFKFNYIWYCFLYSTLFSDCYSSVPNLAVILLLDVEEIIVILSKGRPGLLVQMINVEVDVSSNPEENMDIWN